MIVVYSVILIFLLVISAIISGTETSVFALDSSEEEQLAEIADDDRRAKRALTFKNDSDRFLSVILIANNLVNIAATLVANEILTIILQSCTISDTLSVILRIVLVTFILLLTGEIIPKILANNNPVRFILLFSSFIYLLYVLLYPISWILLRLGGSIAKRVPAPDEPVSRMQLQQAIEITDTNSQQDKRILSGIATFSTLEAVEICIPRVDVFALEDNLPFSTVLKSAVEKGFSRIPVFHEDFDHITGILYVKDLLPYIDSPDDFRWQSLIRDPYFVPEHKKIDDLLSEFRRRKIHIAIVVDEYGGSLGIITMEDILEEIIGDITDESDHQENFYQKLSKNTWMFEGKTHIVDFLRILKLDPDYLDPVRGESDTLAGVMLEIKGDFFKAYDKVSYSALTFTADKVDGFKISQVKVRLDENHQ